MDLVNFLELVEAKFLRARHASVADATLAVIRERRLGLGDLAEIIPTLSVRMIRLGVPASELDPNSYTAKSLVLRLKQFVAVAVDHYLQTKDPDIAAINVNRRGLNKR